MRLKVAARAVRYDEERPHQALRWRTPAAQRTLNPSQPLDRAA
ncbi:MAG: hypothetical protein IT386_10130 [Deltaproteobacteria bacterium]|nr:hypothetical protein [Deltaproteobacteria bacterium]